MEFVTIRALQPLMSLVHMNTKESTRYVIISMFIGPFAWSGYGYNEAIYMRSLTTPCHYHVTSSIRDNLIGAGSGSRVRGAGKGRWSG